MSTQDSETADDAADESPGTVAGTINTDALGVAVDALRAAHDEAVFEFDPEGVRALNVDPGSVLMSLVEIDADVWASYEATSLRTALRLERFEDFALVGDATEIEWNTESFRFDIDSGPVSASMATINPERVRTQDVSDDVYAGATTSWEMPYDTLKQWLRVTTKLKPTAAQIHVASESEPSDFIGVRKTGDTDTVEFAFDDATNIERPPEHVMVKQSEDYLSRVKQSVPNDATLAFQTASDFPMVIEYEHEGVSVTHLQAPRLDTE